MPYVKKYYCKRMLHLRHLYILDTPYIRYKRYKTRQNSKRRHFGMGWCSSPDGVKEWKQPDSPRSPRRRRVTAEGGRVARAIFETTGGGAAAKRPFGRGPFTASSLAAVVRGGLVVGRSGLGMACHPDGSTLLA